MTPRIIRGGIADITGAAYGIGPADEQEGHVPLLDFDLPVEFSDSLCYTVF